MTSIAEVRLWGRTIGAVSLQPGDQFAAFEYVPEFVDSSIELAPLQMPLASRIYRFNDLSLQSFYGLPGLLADSLPDRFGNALINAWLARQGRRADEFNTIERLCYTGERGMGALEFKPAIGPDPSQSNSIDINALVDLASDILNQRQQLKNSLQTDQRQAALQQILKIGTSAGGARAKAVIAWNPDTNEVRSGQVPAAEGFGYWILKFDGVSNNRDKELADPQGFGAIEFAYSNMAKACGINMHECRLLEEHGRRHFMTRRFDREIDGSKLHMQSLGAMDHLDFNQAGAHSYEQALLVIRRLNIGMQAMEQQFRRMAFNIVARNQDDHVKNIAFLMNKSGDWSLSPAYDITYSYNPDGDWTSAHQMTMNGKRDGFDMNDFESCARVASLKRGSARAIVEEVIETVSLWEKFATEAEVDAATVKSIQQTLRLSF